MSKNREKFNESLKVASEVLKDSKFVLIISHHDADGLSAAGLLAKSLMRLGVLFHIRILFQPTYSIISSLLKSESSVLVFCDMGSGQIDQIIKVFKDYPDRRRQVIILDHHQPLLEDFEDSEIVHVNPMLFGFDGAEEISASGVTYFVARALDEKNKDLSSLALVGALGDKQDKEENHGFYGLNREILEDGKSVEAIVEIEDIRIFGRERDPIPLALEYTIDPLVPGVSLSPETCNKFLSGLNIPLKKDGVWRTISDLSDEEKQKLLEAIVEKIAEKRREDKTSISKEIFGKEYIFPQESKDSYTRNAREYDALISSCGRSSKNGVGVSICLGDRGETYKEGVKIFNEYRAKFARSLQWFINNEKKAVEQLKHIQFIDGRGVVDEFIISHLASVIAINRLLSPEKPLLTLAGFSEDLVKISGRANEYLVKKGVNLGLAMREASTLINEGAVGGGHNIAAGAKVPEKLLEKFLKIVDEIIAKQLISSQD